MSKVWVTGARGIRNESGVSCHISSALQLIYWSLSSEACHLLQNLSNTIQSQCQDARRPICVSFLVELGSLFGELGRYHPPYADDLPKKLTSPEDVTSKKGVDARELYSTLNIDSNCMGDAASSLRIILNQLQKSLDDMTEIVADYYDINKFDELKEVLRKEFWAGSIASQIVGRKVFIRSANDEDEEVLITRSRHPKIRNNISPIPVTVKGFSDLASALADTFTKPQYISSYTWEGNDIIQDERILIRDKSAAKVERKDESQTHSSDEDHLTDSSPSFSNSSCISSSTSSSSLSSEDSSVSSFSIGSSTSSSIQEEWLTERRSWLHTLPKTLCFHLKRFEYVNGCLKKVGTRMDVPYELDMTPFTHQRRTSSGFEKNGTSFSRPSRECPACYKYLLQGAIVHIDKSTQQTAEIDAHYVTYTSISKKHDPITQNSKGRCVSRDADFEAESNIWVKIDDEKASTFSLKTDPGKAECLDGGIEVSHETFLNILRGSVSSSCCRYATSLSYSSKCDCQVKNININAKE